MNQKCTKSRKVGSEIKNTPGSFCTPLRTTNYRGVPYSPRVLLIKIERFSRKMEVLEFEEEEENIAPSDFDDDDNHDNTDLFCEEDDEEDCDLCSACGENPFAYLVQPCGHLICTKCLKKK